MTIKNIIRIVCLLVSIVFLGAFFNDIVVENKDFIMKYKIEILLYIFYLPVLLASITNNYLWVPNGYEIYKKNVIKSKCIRLAFLTILVIVAVIFNEFSPLLTIFVLLELINFIPSISSQLLAYRNSEIINGKVDKKLFNPKIKQLDNQIMDQIKFKSILLFTLFILTVGMIMLSSDEQKVESLQSIVDSFNGLSFSLLMAIIYRIGNLIYKANSIIKMSRLEARAEAEYRRNA